MKGMSLLILVLMLSCNIYGDENTRELTLPADKIELLRIDAGAGVLRIQGMEDLQQIEATATIIITRANNKERDQILAEDIVLDLRKTDATIAGLVSQYI